MVILQVLKPPGPALEAGVRVRLIAIPIWWTSERLNPAGILHPRWQTRTWVHDRFAVNKSMHEVSFSLMPIQLQCARRQGFAQVVGGKYTDETLLGCSMVSSIYVYHSFLVGLWLSGSCTMCTGIQTGRVPAEVFRSTISSGLIHQDTISTGEVYFVLLACQGDLRTYRKYKCER